MPYIYHSFTFVETRLFSRLMQDYLSDDEYAALQHQLAEKPDAGVLIRGSGGLRKIRVARRGRGKSGGYRVIYYVVRPKNIIWMLTIYPKNVADSIPAQVLRNIREELEND